MNPLAFQAHFGLHWVFGALGPAEVEVVIPGDPRVDALIFLAPSWALLVGPVKVREAITEFMLIKVTLSRTSVLSKVVSLAPPPC